MVSNSRRKYDNSGTIRPYKIDWNEPEFNEVETLLKMIYEDLPDTEKTGVSYEDYSKEYRPDIESITESVKTMVISKLRFYLISEEGVRFITNLIHHYQTADTPMRPGMDRSVYIAQVIIGGILLQAFNPLANTVENANTYNMNMAKYGIHPKSTQSTRDQNS